MNRCVFSVNLCDLNSYLLFVVTVEDGSQIAYLHLEDVYVTLRAEVLGSASRNQPETLELDHILRVGDRLSVVGGPGCGKTTVLIYIAWVLAKAILEDRPTWAAEKLGLQLDAQHPTLPLPIYLPLSAYARYRFRGEKPRSGAEQTLPDFLPHYLRGKHSSIDRLPADFFTRLLATGRDVLLLLVAQLSNTAVKAVEKFFGHVYQAKKLAGETQRGSMSF